MSPDPCRRDHCSSSDWNLALNELRLKCFCHLLPGCAFLERHHVAHQACGCAVRTPNKLLRLRLVASATIKLNYTLLRNAQQTSKEQQVALTPERNDVRLLSKILGCK